MYLKRSDRPYVGITGFTTNDQVRDMLAILRQRRHTFNRFWHPAPLHRLHVGVMMSRKTLRGLESSWAGIFPTPTQIKEIFTQVNDSGVRNHLELTEDLMFCLHYADFGGTEDLETDLKDALDSIGHTQTALQLDMEWPDPDAIRRTVDYSPKDIEVILQVGKGAFKQIGHDPERLVKRLRQYQNCITHVLLDLSMGEGKAMDADVLLPHVTAIGNGLPQLRIVVAGGLGPETVVFVEPIVKAASDTRVISIDAEGQLRASGSNRDPVDWKRAGDYLAQALQVLR